MDEFGVLVESIGFRAHGKSAPIAKLKPKPKSNSTPNFNNTTNSSSFNDSSSLPVDELDGVFQSNFNINGTRQSENFFGGDDIFGGSSQFGGVDFESVLNVSDNRKNGMNSMNSVGSNGFDDLLGLKSKPSGGVDDLFGNVGVSSTRKPEKKGSAFDDFLIPGFGGASSSKIDTFNRVHSETNLSRGSNSHPSNSSSTMIDDPFLVFESSVSQSDSSWPFAGPSEQNIGKRTVQSPIDDDFGVFATGGAHSGLRIPPPPNPGTVSNGFGNGNDLDAIFGGGKNVQQKAKPSSTDQDSIFGEFFREEKATKVKQTPSQSSFGTKEASSTANVGNDFTSLFGDIATSSGEFQEIEGEPADRRSARLKRYMRVNARMAEALAEKNQRDHQSQCEQEEKHRIAETVDNDIKRWAAGKEGNIRALLSSLHQILWPECGWRPVSLTDMITSQSVRKVYKKATLYVHPDKVQQKGANLEQKYIAEKVFDLLKEASNKFSAEELR